MRAVYPGNRYTTHKKWLVCPLLAITGTLCSVVPHLALTCWARVELGVTSVCRHSYSCSYSSGAYCGLHDCSRRQFRRRFNPAISSTLIILRRVWWGNSFVRPWPVSRHYCDIEALYLGMGWTGWWRRKFPPFPHTSIFISCFVRSTRLTHHNLFDFTSQTVPWGRLYGSI
jgi:hypothetical protein